MSGTADIGGSTAVLLLLAEMYRGVLMTLAFSDVGKQLRTVSSETHVFHTRAGRIQVSFETHISHDRHERVQKCRTDQENERVGRSRNVVHGS